MGMMSRSIQILPAELASQIAAGEVVERPRSIVKELIENSLDAGARRIFVGIVDGGLSSILVRDDGHGMLPGDARLCLLRHATSKLSQFSDLDALLSYGFRGEALPSIASVSRLTLSTRAEGEQSGVCLVYQGLACESEAPIGRPVGTEVLVEKLFEGVPARRKFLRSPSTESGYISETFEQMALCRPGVGFTLARDGREVRRYAEVASRRERAAQVFAEDTLTALEGTRGPLALLALLSSPDRAVRGAQKLTLIVNGRPVTDRGLLGTLAHAYGDRLERGYYPRGVVYLDLPAHLVDVNVHPQKSEVRFADPRALAEAVYQMVAQGVSGQSPETSRSLPAHGSRNEWGRRSTNGPAPPSTSPFRVRPEPSSMVADPRHGWGALRAAYEQGKASDPIAARVPHAPPVDPQAVSGADRSPGCLWMKTSPAGHLLAESEKGLWIVSADELSRALFVRTMEKRPGEVRSVPLVFPVRISLRRPQTPKEALDDPESQLRAFGIDLRFLEGNMALLRALPPGLENCDLGELSQVLELALRSKEPASCGSSSWLPRLARLFDPKPSDLEQRLQSEDLGEEELIALFQHAGAQFLDHRTLGRGRGRN